MHYVLTLAGDLKIAAESHVQIRNDDDRVRSGDKAGWSVITLSQIKNKIEKFDTLYINTHGRVVAVQTKSQGLMAKAGNLIQLRSKYVGAKGFYDFIKDFLPKDRIFKLKIFACYSAGSAYERTKPSFSPAGTFAGQFASALHKTHPLIWVYGYRDEVAMAATYDFKHQQAGKVPTLVEDRNGRISIEPSPIRQRGEDDRAKHHRSLFLPRGVVESDWQRWLSGAG